MRPIPLYRRAGLALAACLLAAGAAAVGPSGGRAEAGVPQVLGTGSSFAGPAILQWQSDVSPLGLNINYQTSSSVNGLNQFAQNLVDFGASEIGFSTGQADSTPSQPYQYLPDVSGGISFAYNLKDANNQPLTTLRLSTATLFKIWTDQITQWNDPAIQADNPGAALPSLPIKVVYRADPAGESYILTYYFYYLFGQQWQNYVNLVKGTSASALCPYCNAFYPHYDASNGAEPPGYNFNNWVGQNGSDAASGYVAAAGSNGAITYVETAWAKLYHLPVAAIQDFGGGYSLPTSQNVAVALTKAVLYPDYEEDLRGVFTNPAAGAYPLSSYSYLLTATGSISAAKGNELSQFIYFLACKGQSQMAALGYSPIPPNLVSDDLAAGQRLNGATAAPPMDAQHCQNPYVDGQMPLVGEPTVLKTGGGVPSGGGGVVTVRGGRGQQPTASAASTGGPAPGTSRAGAAGTGPSSATTALGTSAGVPVTGLSASPAILPPSMLAALKPLSGAGRASGSASLTGSILSGAAQNLQRKSGPTAAMMIGLGLFLLLLVGPPAGVLARLRITRTGRPTDTGGQR